VVVERDTTLVAEFEKKKFDLYYGIADDSDNYTKMVAECEGNVSITAKPPNTCYKFLYWIDTTQKIISYNNPLDVEVICDTILGAVFEEMSYELTIHIQGEISYITANCDEVLNIIANNDECCIKFSH